MNPYVKRLDALLGRITLLFLAVLVMSPIFRPFDRLLFWFSLVGGGYCGALWLLLRLTKGKGLIPENMRKLPVDSPAFRQPVYSGPGDKGKQTTRWIAADFKNHRRILLPFMLVIGIGFYMLFDWLPAKGFDKFLLTVLKYSIIPLMIAFCGGMYAMLWSVERQSKVCLTIEEAAADLQCTPDELDSVLAARGIGPRFVVGTVPKYHPADISGVESLLRPALAEHIAALLRASADQASDPQQLLRAADHADDLQ